MAFREIQDGVQDGRQILKNQQNVEMRFISIQKLLLSKNNNIIVLNKHQAIFYSFNFVKVDETEATIHGAGDCA